MITEVWSPPHPIDLGVSIARYSRWGEDLLNVVDGGALYRVNQSGDPYRICQRSAGEMQIDTPGDIGTAVAEAQYQLSASLPLSEVQRLGERVPSVAAKLVRMPGYRPPMSNGVLESLMGSISAQQVNLRWAGTTRNRLVQRYGVRHTFGGVAVWECPAPEVLATAEPEDIREMQYTTRKSEYIIAAARAIRDGTLSALESASDTEVIDRITSVRGLGRWTAEWYLARTLARPGVIAAGDLGVRKAVSRFVAGSDEMLSESEVRTLTSDWGDGGNWGIHLLLEALPAT